MVEIGKAAGKKITALITDMDRPLGSAVNTYPNLNSVGFAARAGESATFTNYTISNGGRFATGTLLDADTGAAYAIFDGLDGVTVDGNTIIVEGGENGYLVLLFLFGSLFRFPGSGDSLFLGGTEIFQTLFRIDRGLLDDEY